MILLIEAVIGADHPHPHVSLLHSGSAGADHVISPHSLTVKPHPVIYILLLVLSIHSIIVGMALGAQSSISEALVVFIAIVAHKIAAGFALGISYRRAGSTFPSTAPVAVLFSSMTPLGILAGTAVEALISSGGRNLFEVIFDSVGAGTFLYIASVDIIRTEFACQGDRWQKWLLATLGFSMMAVLAIWI